ncbi:hypothetical protein Nepgr_016640 [Nepenthes gracilis]|uniref:Filament-like plant protein 7 n=1 Tax=Nepenthes gracilis TaxID=150966 RepID=A0AAD3SQ23_NEPGR|nr:hypothetical protein Nepgr_016640 [Nepenthes gracilis]
MTDHKSWIWGRKSSDQSIAVAEKVDFASKRNEEEMHMVLAEKAELERDLRDLSNKLSSALYECNAKDDDAQKHAKIAQESLAGLEKAEAKALSLEQELNEAVQNRAASEERASRLCAALKDCVQQLHLVREEQEQRIRDALTVVSRDFEKARLVLEEKLAESSTMIAQLCAENARLSKALLLKDQVIEDLNQQRTKVDADFNSLLARLECMEKDDTALKYEVRVLKKELDVRNDEIEFNRQIADAAHKQHLDNVKKMAKLESECQRLRTMVRKRLPGPTMVAKMKNEVQMLERGATDPRRKRLDANPTIPRWDYAIDTCPESPGKKINILTGRLSNLEEENTALRETLQKKTNELQISRHMYAQTASRLSQLEAQVEESSKGQMMEFTRNSATSLDLSLASMSDIGSDAGSWASALITELEHFRDRKQKHGVSCKSIAVSDISLMDDFVQMEKLALVCVDNPIENYCPQESNGREMVAMSCPNQPKTGESINARTILSNSIATESCLIGRKPVDMPEVLDSFDARIKDMSRDKTVRVLKPKLRSLISKLVKTVKGINLSSQGYDNSSSMLNPTGYMVRVFQWKTSEMATVVQNLLHTCVDLFDGKADFETFIQELASTLEWMISHCFSLQDVSCVKDAIKEHILLDESRSECQLDVGMMSPFSKNDMSTGLKEEIGMLKVELKNTESVIKDLEHRLQSSIEDGNSWTKQLRKLEKTTASLQGELEGSKNSKDIIEDQIENMKLTNEDLNLQLSLTRIELNESRQNLLSQEAELDNKRNLCEELQARCLELQLQLESVNKLDSKKHAVEEEKQLRTEQEISAASEKLARCQETILNLGEQLKALASARDTTLLDKVKSSPTHSMATITEAVTGNKRMNSRSLLDQMLAEDDDEAERPESLQTREITCNSDAHKSSILNNWKSELEGLEVTGKHMAVTTEAAVGSLAIVTRAEKNGGFLKRLLWRKKKVNSKRPPFAT